MKTITLRFGLMVVVFLLLSSSAFSSNLTDTIQLLPFTENWESASFTTNNWSFPWMQGNWTILTSDGDPSPCAIFPGIPIQTNYIYALQTPYLDARSLVCDKIYLDFDLKFHCITSTGTEWFRIFLNVDTNRYTYLTLTNTGDYDWQHFRIHLAMAESKLFTIMFVASGTNSSYIDEWMIDNIKVSRECKPPKNLTTAVNGSCGKSNCQVYLTWQAPVCPSFTELTELIYDPGWAEDGVGMWTSGWAGNEFPVYGYSGIVKSFDLYFWYNPNHGTDQLTLDVFDQSHNLIGSSDPFTPPDDGWITVNVPDIPFNDVFYGMVKWLNTGPTNYLGFNCDCGNYSDNAYIVWDNQWILLASTMYCGLNTNFLARAYVLMRNETKVAAQNDSTELIGYNIYRSTDGSSFTLINTNPAGDTSFADMINCEAYYYLTSVYNNCESLATDTISTSCYVGIPDPLQNKQFEFYPNPSEGIIKISGIPEGSDGILKIYSPDGRVLYSTDIHTGSYDFSFLNNGTYLITLQGERDSYHYKLIILK